MEPTNPRIGSSLNEFMRVESEDFNDGYVAGLRRAQELAKEHLSGTFREFDQAIDAEAKK